MSEEKKVICPWCGEEMWLKTDGIGWWYECNACSAQSPNENGNASALDAALDMYKPLQKPLTLEETIKLCETEPCVIVELVNGVCVHAGKCEKSEKLPYMTSVTMIGFNAVAHFVNEDYGRLWRCWATKPTDEEREAAKWET